MDIDNKAEEYTQIFSALAHPIRLTIACGLLKFGKCNVNNISEKMKVSQSLISQHVKILKTAGIIQGKREGNIIWYSLSSELAEKLLSNIDLKLCP